MTLRDGQLEDGPEATARWRAIVEHMQMGLAVYRLVNPLDDTSLELVDINPAAEGILGISRPEGRGKRMVDLFPGVHQSGNHHIYAQVARGGASIDLGQVHYVDRRLGEIEFAVKAFPLEDHGVGILFENVTAQVETQRMKDHLVDMVSHELRTPLTSIRGALGLLGSGGFGDLPPEAASLIALASRGCDRLCRLVNDLLDAGKIDAGRMDFQSVEQDVGSALHAAADGLAVLAAAKSVRLEVETPEAPVHLRLDPDRFHQVLTNLLSNAVKFAPEQSAVALRTVLDGDLVRIEVEDHGPGIPAAFRDRMFQRFAQASGSKAGTGLGLHLAKAFTEHMGGAIGFDSEEGQGARFFLTFPRAAPLALRPMEKPTILVVEDDPDIALLLGLLLRKEGWDAVTAKDAIQARALLSAPERFAALTLDLHLPGEHGLSLLRDLRAREATRDLPIIVVSAWADPEREGLAGEALGILDWLEKPIDADRLVRAVRRALAKGGRAHILHVEDDADLQVVVAALLAQDAIVDAVPSLAAAQRYLAGTKPDLILLDLLLPDGHGLELMPLVSSLEGTPPPVVIFSSHEPPPGAIEGVAARIVKTHSSPEALLRPIRALLAAKRDAI